jgi:hypothetical protein
MGRPGVVFTVEALNVHAMTSNQWVTPSAIHIAANVRSLEYESWHVEVLLRAMGNELNCFYADK